jgi:hypothetical protein
MHGISSGPRTYLVLLVLHEPVDEVRADEARATGDQDPHVGLDESTRQSIRIRSTRAGREKQRGGREIAHLEELGEAERRGRRRRAGDGLLAVAAIGLLLRHRTAVRSHRNQRASGNEMGTREKGREAVVKGREGNRDLRGGRVAHRASWVIACELARARAV